MKKCGFLQVILILVFCLISVGSAIASESGTCGEQLTWVLDDDGVLTISGTGAIYNYDYDTDPAPWPQNQVKRVVVEDGVTNLGTYAFAGCKNLTDIDLPDSVTSLGYFNTFEGCSSLTGITIPKGVSNINVETFSGCSSLTDIVLPDSVGIIGTSAFKGCSSLTNIVLPDGVSVINTSTFEGCSSLQSITLPASIRNISVDAFKDCNQLESVYCEKKRENIQIAAGGNKSLLDATWYCLKCGENLTWRLDGEGVLTISGTGAMYDYTNEDPAPWPQDKVKRVVAADGVTTIGSGAFSGCIYMSDIKLPNSATEIGSRAFEVCHSLEDITIPDGVTTIAASAFEGCLSLRSITLPANITRINELAFKSCDLLKDVYYKGTAGMRDEIEIIENGNERLLNAVWHYAKSTVITLDKQGGVSGDDTVTAVFGLDMPTVTMPTLSGSIFAGYFDAATGGTQYYAADGSSLKAWDKEAETATLYAHWTAKTIILIGISITKVPDKLTYTEGETFDKSGMIVTAAYSDGSTKPVMNYEVKPAGALTIADTTVEISYSEKDETKAVKLTIKVNPAGPVMYTIISGANQMIFTDAASAVFCSDADFSKFDHVDVDDKTIAKKYYYAASGSTEITFNQEFIKMLSVGKHKLTIASKDGSASTNFIVREPVPKTGDNTNLALLIMLLIASMSTILLISVRARKKV